MIKNIDFVSVPCTDQKRALEFYTKRLGLTVFTDQPFGEGEGAQRWIELKIAGAQTKLVLFTPDDQKGMIGKMTNFSLTVDNVEKEYARLRELGVEFLAPPKQETWGTFAIFLDSEGNKLLINEK